MNDVLEKMQAEIDVLRAYVQALLQFVPHDPISGNVITAATRRLNAESSSADPGRKAALDLALQKTGAQSYLSQHAAALKRGS